MTASQRAGRAKSAQVRHVISQREVEVLRSVECFRFLTAKQIEQLLFCEHASPVTAARTCRRVLERLASHRLLWRLERRIGGIYAGSASYVYALGTMGYRVLHEQSMRARRKEPSEEFLDHTLAVAQLAVDLQCVGRKDGIEILEAEPEPGCWRGFSLGVEGRELLKPDLSVVVCGAEYEYHWFVEVDRSTHSAASVVRKCRLYQRYWTTGIEQEACGLFPQVLFVASGERRVALLEREIERAGRLEQKLFRICTTDEAVTTLTGVLP